MENTVNSAIKQSGLRLVFGDLLLGVHGENFHYLFSYEGGGPQSMVVDGREWLYRTPAPTYWRASTDNDKGSGFPFDNAMWMGADQFTRPDGVSIWVDGVKEEDFMPPRNNRFKGDCQAKEVKIQYRLLTATVPATCTQVSYTVRENGVIQTDVHYHGREGLGSLPVFGLRFVIPTKALGYVYTGLSGETYPDRMAGGIRGTYQVEGLPVTPYLVPQDCGVHMETEEVTIFRNSVLANTDHSREPFSLTFQMCGKPFAFSCLPYTALELESALHQEELPPARRTVLCILGAVRGVGGIDSWGSDIEEAYRIDGSKDIEFSFLIHPEKSAR